MFVVYFTDQIFTEPRDYRGVFCLQKDVGIFFQRPFCITVSTAYLTLQRAYSVNRFKFDYFADRDQSCYHHQAERSKNEYRKRQYIKAQKRQSYTYILGSA